MEAGAPRSHRRPGEGPHPGSPRSAAKGRNAPLCDGKAQAKPKRGIMIASRRRRNGAAHGAAITTPVSNVPLAVPRTRKRVQGFAGWRRFLPTRPSFAVASKVRSASNAAHPLTRSHSTMHCLTLRELRQWHGDQRWLVVPASANPGSRRRSTLVAEAAEGLSKGPCQSRSASLS